MTKLKKHRRPRVPVSVRLASRAGKAFGEIAEIIAKYSSDQNVNPGVDDAYPGSARFESDVPREYIAALRLFSDAERLKIESVSRREGEIGSEGPKSETSSTKERALRAEVELVSKLKQIGVVFAHDARGDLTVLPAPTDYDYEGLAEKLSKTSSSLPLVQSQAVQGSPQTLESAPSGSRYSGSLGASNPRILFLAGPLKDRTIPLSSEVTLGREAANSVAVPDPSVSRRHCVLRRGEDGRFRIEDLTSRVGTLVNGVPVREQWLHHGDEIAIGDSAFIVMLEDEQSALRASRVDLDESQAPSGTKSIHPKEGVYLEPDKLLLDLPRTSQIAGLSALFKMSRVVHAIRDLEELQAQLLDLIFEVLPAERGAILLAEGAGEDFHSLYARTRDPGHPLVRVSRTIARRVIRENVAMLGANVSRSRIVPDAEYEVEALASPEIHSLLCVPLSVFNRVIGCIYLETSSQATKFNEDHLQLMTAIAGISSMALENARRLQWLEQENQRLAAEVRQEQILVGEGRKMQEIRRFLARVGPSDSTVLIEGESGTGKELAARALHRNSPRHDKPFVAINCAAIPESLLESDLFGHERGAFTGATTQKKGRLEVADGGVVFIDEIGELVPALQVKLLRFLQEREFERLGGTHHISINVRIIAATHLDLTAAVRDGRFRQDLYYRLAVVKLNMPPLRERSEDIELLARHFVSKYIRQFNMRAKTISTEAMRCLVNYDWPGNVRELENTIERAFVLSATDVILPEDLPESVLEKAPSARTTPYHREVRRAKQDLIVKALDETKGNDEEAARILGVDVLYLHRLIRNLDLPNRGVN